MADPTCLLVPSPLLGARTWQPVAAWLGEQGRRAVVVETGTPTGPDDVLGSVQSAADGLGPLTLVPHSNAGLYAPALGEQLELAAAVFVDAALAGAGPDTEMAPAGLLSMLQELADPDGMLPPWTRWWDPADLERLFPSDDVRRGVEAGEPRLPLSYFSARLPVPADWAERPCAYLAFGTTYAEEVAFARLRGWPVSTIDARHLQMLHDPAGVGAEILRLESLLV